MQGDIVVINYDTSLVSGIYKFKDGLLFDDINSSHPFLLWYCHYFTEALSDPLCQGHYVYFATLIASIYYSKQSVVDSRKLEGY